MEPSRLQEIVKPLEVFFAGLGFQLEGKPLVEEALYSALFVLTQEDHETRLNYSLEVFEDKTNFSKYRLDVRLTHPDGETVKIQVAVISSMLPAHESVENRVKYDLKPRLDKLL